MNNLIVLALAMQLGSDDFPRREAAQACLSKLDNEVYITLWLTKKHTDHEIANRSKQLLLQQFARDIPALSNNPNWYAPWLWWAGRTIDSDTEHKFVALAASLEPTDPRPLNIYNDSPSFKAWRKATVLYLRLSLADDHVPSSQLADVLYSLYEAEDHYRSYRSGK